MTLEAGEHDARILELFGAQRDVLASAIVDTAEGVIRQVAGKDSWTDDKLLDLAGRALDYLHDDTVRFLDATLLSPQQMAENTTGPLEVVATDADRTVVFQCLETPGKAEAATALLLVLRKGANMGLILSRLRAFGRSNESAEIGT